MRRLTRRGFIMAGAAVVALAGTFGVGKSHAARTKLGLGGMAPRGLCRIWVEVGGVTQETMLFGYVPTHADREEAMHHMAQRYTRRTAAHGVVEVKERITFADGTTVKGTWRP